MYSLFCRKILMPFYAFHKTATLDGRRMILTSHIGARVLKLHSQSPCTQCIRQMTCHSQPGAPPWWSFAVQYLDGWNNTPKVISMCLSVLFQICTFLNKGILSYFVKVNKSCICLCIMYHV